MCVCVGRELHVLVARIIGSSTELQCWWGKLACRDLFFMRSLEVFDGVRERIDQDVLSKMSDRKCWECVSSSLSFDLCSIRCYGDFCNMFLRPSPILWLPTTETSLTGMAIYLCVCGYWLGIKILRWGRPFVDARAQFHGMNLQDEIGFAPDSQNEYKCRPVIHMDAFRYHIPFPSHTHLCSLNSALSSVPVQVGQERQLPTSG